ncbi:MAG: hypothetical protein IT178_07635 [Acidobacteria bacterium]|nr:hypothetical protein [Acidobacteriota bacterium]
MKRFVMTAGVLAMMTAGAPAQDQAETIAKAVQAAPRAARDGAMVIRWKPDFTYDTLRPGTNRIVCYDQSGLPTEQPFSVQCTSVGNLERVAQNRRFEAETDREKRQAALDAAEKDGTRVKPEYGSVFYTLSGADATNTRLHVTIAIPGATSASTGLPDNNKQGGAWIMAAGTTGAHIMTPGS